MPKRKLTKTKSSHSISEVVAVKAEGISSPIEQKLDKCGTVETIAKVEVANHEIDMKLLPVENWLNIAELALGNACAKRVLDSTKFIGAHVTVAGGLHKAPLNAAEIGCRAFGLFVRNQRRWEGKPLDEDIAQEFRKNCAELGFDQKHIVVHGSYLLNAGSANKDTLNKTRIAMLDEVQRCEKLGLTLYNFHPGSTCGMISVGDCIKIIAESINFIHQQTRDVTVVLENMSGQGNTVGGKFEELKEIIEHVEDKTRIGVCLDSCHLFAAGFDLIEKIAYEKTMSDFDSIIGFKYLKAVHLNDSKGKCGCHLDRHENIGKGKIGLRGFEHFLKDPRLDDIPMILETPMTLTDTEEIKILYSL